jgi:RNA polymerase sigma factor for flagellar operon FliA
MFQASRPHADGLVATSRRAASQGFGHRMKPERRPSAEEVASYMPVILGVVGGLLRRFPPNVLREDLVSGGLVGLLDAFRRNPERGPAFDGYVCIRVRGAVFDELRAQDWLPRRARERATLASSVDACGRVTSIDLADLPEEHVAALTDQTPSPEEQACVRICLDRLALAVGALPEREANILTWHYLQGTSLQDIAVRLEISRPRVSQLHSRALRALRETAATF